MENSFTEYCTSINLSEVQIKRIDKILEDYLKILKEPIKSIFVSEQMNNEGIRLYMNLWIITENYICEAKSFLSQDDYDITVFKDRIKYMQFIKSEYEFGSVATNKSNLTIEFIIIGELSCILRASGNNCSKLESFYNDHLVSNWI